MRRASAQGARFGEHWHGKCAHIARARVGTRTRAGRTGFLGVALLRTRPMDAAMLQEARLRQPMTSALWAQLRMLRDIVHDGFHGTTTPCTHAAVAPRPHDL